MKTTQLNVFVVRIIRQLTHSSHLTQHRLLFDHQKWLFLKNEILDFQKSSPPCQWLTHPTDQSDVYQNNLFYKIHWPYDWPSFSTESGLQLWWKHQINKYLKNAFLTIYKIYFTTSHRLAQKSRINRRGAYLAPSEEHSTGSRPNGWNGEYGSTSRFDEWIPHMA